MSLTDLFFVHNLKIKLHQVKAKDPSLYPNQKPFGPNNVHNKVFGLTCMDVKEFKKKLSYNSDYEKNVQNSYQVDQNQNHKISEEYYL